MDASELRDYTKWHNKSAERIRAEVRAARGWSNVFQGPLPLWAHRVRNYFNEEPMFLFKLDEKASQAHLGKLRGGVSPFAWRRIKWLKKHPVLRYLPQVQIMPNPPAGTADMSWGDDIGETFALTADVYQDASGRIWHQMSPGGSIYHWGSEPVIPQLEAVTTSIRTQALVPIFKLVAPDGTGGSSETILVNRFDQRPDIGLVASVALGPVVVLAIRQIKVGSFYVATTTGFVDGLNVTDPHKKGSYNFSETSVVGLEAHKKRDVEPHEKHSYKLYLNPDRHTPLSARIFPVNDPDGKPLATQV